MRLSGCYRAAVAASWLATSTTVAQATWRPALASGVVPQRTYAVAYDAARGRLVLYGGAGCTGNASGTWELDRGQWGLLPQNAGPARYEHAIAFDAARNRTVLFGGRRESDNVLLADTWIWDGLTWTQVSPSQSPTPRHFHLMAYDATANRVVLFGGKDGSGRLNDTWGWDGANWTPIPTPNSPPGREGGAMAMAANNRIILFAGRTPPAPPVADTWVFDGNSWTLDNGASPPGRFAHAMAFDPQRGVTVLFGGDNGSGLLGDSWEWNGSAWTQRTSSLSPPPRSGHGMAYHALRGDVVLVGTAGNLPTPDAWVWNGVTWATLEPTPGAHAPWLLAADEVNRRVVLFGGYTCATAEMDETWLWDGVAWEQRFPAVKPPARNGHAIVFDRARGEVVLFGGRTSANRLADTWTWNGASWMQKTSTANPPRREVAGVAYDQVRQRVVLFGGLGGPNPDALNDTWEWDGTQWSQRTPATAPLARLNLAMVYDQARQRTVLFGGRDSIAGNELSDTWEWDGTSWVQRFPAISPPGRHAHSLAYDAGRARVVLFGGLPYRNDTWEWDGTTWSQITAPQSPQPRYDHATVYDATARAVVLFGGATAQLGHLLDTWEYTARTAAFRPFGDGCRGSSGLTPRLARRRLPFLGESFDVVVDRMQPNMPAVLLLDAVATSPPISLAGFGAPGCFLHVMPLATLAQGASGSGVAAWLFPIPSQPHLLGNSVFLQSGCLDLAANTLGLVTTNAAEATIGQ